MPLSREQQITLATLAGRAPSPHNIQPARWRFSGHMVELWEDTHRWLSVGDPAGRDNTIALGMAWEGMSIALSGEGLCLELQSRTESSYPPAQPGIRLIARGVVSSGAVPNALLPSLSTRSAYRGMFASCNMPQSAKLDECISAHKDIVFSLPMSSVPDVARWYDLAAAEGLASTAFAKELYHWMRFSSQDPRWMQDGLDADCMALSKIEGWGASIALRPSIVKVLSAMSLTRFLVSEADKVKSAARLVLIHANKHTNAFDAGRAWYRFWLALDWAGFSGVPMSALVDSPGYSKKLLDAWPLPAEQKLINIMRVGVVPTTHTARSARLPAEELLLD